MRESFRVSKKLAARKSTCHILPCVIHHNGQVDETKFAPETDDSGSLKIVMRGRDLYGKPVNLPGYQGVIVEADGRVDELEGRQDRLASGTAKLRVNSAFSEIVLWEHGSLPSNDHPWGGRLEELVATSQSISSI